MEKLSQDLTEMFDDEEVVEPTEDMTDMFDDSSEDENTETDKESKEDTAEEATESKEEKKAEDSEEDPDMEELTKLFDEATTTSDDLSDETKEVKWTIEDVQKALSEDDISKVEELVNDLYSQILTYESNAEISNTKYDVLKAKFDEMRGKLDEATMKVEESSATKVSSDPQMRILNRMYDDAVEGSATAKTKVSKMLEDMYYKVTGENLEDKIIEDDVKKGTENKVAWATTEYNYEAPPEDPSLKEGILWLY